MIAVIRDLAPYRTSRDYGRLWLLAQERSYVCIVDFPRTTDGPPLRDVAQSAQVVRVAATCRGVEYASGETPEEFAHAATAVNLEWIAVRGEVT